MSNNTTSIGEYAFRSCTSLSSIIISNDISSNHTISIENFSFWDCTSLIEITFPNNVIYIGKYALYGCTSLKSITCLATTPPDMQNLPTNYETCTLYIPKGTKQAYLNHKEWSKFKNIEEK